MDTKKDQILGHGDPANHCHDCTRAGEQQLECKINCSERYRPGQGSCFEGVDNDIVDDGAKSNRTAVMEQPDHRKSNEDIDHRGQ